MKTRGGSTNLLDPIRLGENALLGGLNPSQRHLPYYNCGFNKGDVTRFCHCLPSDLHHNVARAILALCKAAEVTGNPIRQVVLDDLTETLFTLFDEADAFPGPPSSGEQKRFIILHDLREVTCALSELIQRGEKRAVYWARRMVRRLRKSLDHTGRIHLESLPKNILQYTSQPQQEGRATGALVSYYRLTGDEVALETALLITNHALEHCFTPHGALTEKAGQHGHSINGLVTKILDLALLINDSRLLQRAKLVYDVGLSSFNTSFGWSRERVDEFNQKGEGNSAGDYLRGALLLGQAGFPEYFGKAERILRSHLLPSQVIKVGGFSDNPNAGQDHSRKVASRMRGGFGFRTPNDIIVEDYINPWMGYKTVQLDGAEKLVRNTKNAMLIQGADLLSGEDCDRVITIYDVTAAAVEALCAAWHAIVTEDDAGIRINLLFSHQRKGLTIKSSLPHEGTIEIDNTSGRNLLVRIPHWASPSDISLSSRDVSYPLRVIGSSMLIPADEEHKRIKINFPMLHQRTVESISFIEYTIDWVGDQIVAMSPPGKHLSMFPPCE